MRGNRPSSHRPTGRPWASFAAAVALVAVLFQALASGAMAHTVTDRGVAQVICTAQGAVTFDGGYIDNKAAPDAKGKTSPGLPCQDCLTAATAATAAPDPCAALVRYARKAQVWSAVADTVRRVARAPPRPPSRAPPHA